VPNWKHKNQVMALQSTVMTTNDHCTEDNSAASWANTSIQYISRAICWLIDSDDAYINLLK